MPSSVVGTMVKTLSNCEMVIKRDTASQRPESINTPFEFLHKR